MDANQTNPAAESVPLPCNRAGPARNGGVPYRLEVAKQRNGPTGCVDLIYKPETTTFVEEGEE